MTKRINILGHFLVVLVTCSSFVAIPQTAAQETKQQKERDEVQQALKESYELYKPGVATAIKAALDKAGTAHEISTSIGYKEGEAYSVAWIGALHAELGNRTKAIELLAKAVQLFDQLGAKREKANGLIKLGYQLALDGQRERGQDTLQQGILQYREIGDKIGEADAVSTLGLVYEKQGNGSQAVSYYQQALSLSRAIGDKKQEGLSQLSIGTVLRNQGDRSKALEYFQGALVSFRALRDEKWQFHALANIGRVYEEDGKAEEAVNFYLQALPLIRKLDSASKNTELGLLKRIVGQYQKAGNPTQAKEYDERFLALQRSSEWQNFSPKGRTESNTNTVAPATNNEPRETERTTKTAASGQEKLVAARKLLAEAIALYRTGTEEGFRGALQKGPEAVRLFHEAGDKSGESFALHGMGYLYVVLGENSRALDYYHQALRLRREIGDKRGEGDTLNNLGIIYSDLGDTEKELSYLEEALSLHRVTGEKASEALVLSNIGGVLGIRGEEARALANYQRSLALYREIGEKAGEASALHDIGFVFKALGDTAKALEYFQQSLTLYRSIGNKKDDSEEDNPKYANLSEEERALEYFRLSLSLSRVVENAEGEASVLSSIGSLFRTSGEKGKALDYYERALASYRKMGNRSGVAGMMDSIGSVYGDWGDQGKAVEYANQALTIYRELGEKSGEAVELNNVGVLYSNLGQKQKALDYHQQSLLLERQLKNKRGQAITLSNLMWLLKDLNDLPQATFYGKQSINLYQELRTNIRTIDPRLQRSYLTSIEGVYRFLADLLITQGRLGEAHQVLDLLKDQEYFEFVRRNASEASSLDGRATLTPEEATLEKRYREIADRLTALGAERAEIVNKLNRTSEEEKHLAQLDRDIVDGNTVFQKFLVQLAQELTRPKQVARLEQIEDSEGLMDTLRRLGPGTVALYTLIGEKNYRVVLVTADVRKAYEYPIDAANLNRRVLAFREVLQSPGLDPRPMALEMYKVLIGSQLARDLVQAKARTVMWSLDGVLRYLPVAALYDGQRYLVESYRNVVFTPASHSRLNNPVIAKWRGLGLGVSKAHEGFVALVGVPEELSGIIHDENAKATSTAALPGKVILDEAFTETAMKAGLRESYTVVHIASHFSFQPGNETQSFLLLGDGTHLTLAEVKSLGQLFSGVDLLTLSACNTAIGDRIGDGKEVESFGVIAQKKGANAVMATLWPVLDESTQLFMREFYRLHDSKPNITKGDALREAQLALMRGQLRGNVRSGNGKTAGRGTGDLARQPRFETDSKAPFAHPYFWAPFILIGNWK